MLTNGAVKAATAQPRAYKLADSGGLFLFVTPAGTKSWRQKYRYAGREKLLVHGRWPEISLVEARRRRELAKEALRDGKDPSLQAEVYDTFEQLARAWYDHNEATWSPAHAADVLASLQRDLFPDLGKMISTAIRPTELLNVMHSVERRGCIETARRLRQRLSAIFEFGIAHEIVEQDPAAQLGRAMAKSRPVKPQPALTSIEDCRALLDACELIGARRITVLASRFLALTAVRLDAVRGMRWSELEPDADRADLQGRWIWRVPAERMKLARAKKADPRFAHVVPLSSEAVAVLQEVSRQNGHDSHFGGSNDLIFSGRSGAAPIGEGAIGALYARTRFAGRHVPHGWRSSFATIAIEAMGPEWRIDADRALGHSPKDKVAAAYDRAVLLDRRRQLFDRWGALLAGVGGANT